MSTPKRTPPHRRWSADTPMLHSKATDWGGSGMQAPTLVQVTSVQVTRAKPDKSERAVCAVPTSSPLRVSRLRLTQVTQIISGDQSFVQHAFPCCLLRPGGCGVCSYCMTAVGLELPFPPPRPLCVTTLISCTYHDLILQRRHQPGGNEVHLRQAQPAQLRTA